MMLYFTVYLRYGFHDNHLYPVVELAKIQTKVGCNIISVKLRSQLRGPFRINHK